MGPGVVQAEALRDAVALPGQVDPKLRQLGLGPDGVAQGPLDALDAGRLVGQVEPEDGAREGVDEHRQPQPPNTSRNSSSTCRTSRR